MLFANAFSICQVFPYAPAMVKYLGMTDDNRELGFYAGYLFAAYMAGNFISAYPLGKLADTRGRKQILLLGLWSSTLPQLLFGLAPSFQFALAMRFLQGLPNAMIGTAKAMVPDLVPPHEQGLAMSLLAGTWGFANIVGPSIGGLLVELWPPAFPYLLPNAIGCVLSLIAIVATHKYLPDGYSKRTATPEASAASEATGAGEAASTRLAAADSAAASAAAAEGSLAKPAPTAACVGSATATEGGDLVEVELSSSSAADASSTRRGRRGEADSCSDVFGRWEGSDAGSGTNRSAGSSSSSSSSSSASAADGSPASPRSTRWRSTLPLLLYAMLALMDIMMQELIPLFCYAPVASGGLGVEASAVGAVLTATGVSILSFQVLMLPCLLKRFSTTGLLRASTLLLVPIVILMPNVSLAPVPLRWPLFVVLISASKALAGAFFTCSFMLINNSVPPGGRGSVQGIAMMLASVSRGVGPVAASMLFAWSLVNGLDVPGLGVRFVFLLSGLMGLVSWLVACRMDDSYNRPVVE